MKEAEQICLVASKGGSPTNPGWYHNLISNPKCEIQIGKNKFNAIAREVFDDEREEWWHKMDYMNKGGYSNYQVRTSRKIPVLVLSLSLS